MTSYTPELVRAVVDDLDTIFRDAIANNKLKEVFGKERNAMVSHFILLMFSLLKHKPQNSIMKATRDTREMPAVQAEFNVPRFLWKLISDWITVKHDKILLPRFWEKQLENMKQFDSQNPNQYRLGRTPPGPRPSFPQPFLPMMMPKGVNPHATLTPGPITPAPVIPVENPKASMAPAPVSPVVPVAVRIPQAGPEPGPSTSKVVIDLDEDDEDAEGSEDREAQTAPNLPNKKKPAPRKTPAPLPKPRSKKAPAPKGPTIPAPLPRMIKKHPAPAPTPVNNKGKERMIEPPLTPEPAPDDSDDSVEEWPVKRPVPKSSGREKGKQREPDVSDDSEDEVAKRRPVPKNSGQERNPPCKRCKKTGRTCLDQVGVSSACVHCARVKMKCEPSERTSDDTPEPVKKFTKKKRVSEPGPVPVVRPTASGSKARRVKTPAVVYTDDDYEQPEPAPVQPPVASGSRKKTVNTPKDVFTEWPEHRRSFIEFENYYGATLLF